MGVGAGLYMCDVVKKFTFAISSPDEFLLVLPTTIACGRYRNTFESKILQIVSNTFLAVLVMVYRYLTGVQ